MIPRILLLNKRDKISFLKPSSLQTTLSKASETFHDMQIMASSRLHKVVIFRFHFITQLTSPSTNPRQEGKKTFSESRKTKKCPFKKVPNDLSLGSFPLHTAFFMLRSDREFMHGVNSVMKEREKD